MEQSKRKLNSKDALEQARSLLSKLSSSGQTDVARDLGLSYTLASVFHANSSAMEALNLRDCAVVRAIVELIVRWGISPYLSPGVGIPRQKKKEEEEEAEAGAISQGLSVPNPMLPPQSSSEGILLTSCSLLSSFAMDMDMEKEKGFCVASVVRNYYLVDIIAGFLQVAYGPSLEAGAECEAEAVVLEKRRRKIAVGKLEQAMGIFVVGDMVEALLTLLGQKKEEGPFSSPPPPWLNLEAGKLLSRLVMTDGGVPAVMQRLLGGGVKGDVQVYDNVAAHLAKVPKYVATAEEYYQAVCPQLLPFLPYQNFGKAQPGDGETAQQIFRNIHHTSLLLAGTMIVREPELSETYLLKPILVPLIRWSKSQSQSSGSENLGNKGKGQELTENLIVGNLMRVHALLTAGHRGTNKVRNLVLEKTRPVIPILMMLHYLLETSPMSKPFWAKVMPAKIGLGPDKVKQSEKKGYNKNEEMAKGKVEQKNANEKSDKSTGLTKGFLQQSVSEKTDEDEDLSALGRLKAAVTDLMIAHISELPEDLSCLMLGFLSDLDTRKFMWPSTQGEIWNTLKPSSPRSHTPAEYLSRLLLTCGSWSLVVRLMGDILRNLFNLHQSLNINAMPPLYEEKRGEISSLDNVLQAVQSFEILNEVVGSKALEHDLSAASTLIQDLLNEPSLLNDEDMVELVLHMVHNVLNGFSAKFSEEGSDKQGKEVLISISASLERICSSNSLPEKVKRMSSTLNTRIITILAS